VFRSVREQAHGIGALVFLGLSTGVASAGTVDINCGCVPDTWSDYYGNHYCSCSDSQGLDAWATNEYQRRCTQQNVVVFNPESNSDISAPSTLVRNIPKNVTCTVAETLFPSSGTYVYNECTNWYFSTKHVTVVTFCMFNPPR